MIKMKTYYEYKQLELSPQKSSVEQQSLFQVQTRVHKGSLSALGESENLFEPPVFKLFSPKKI